MHEYFQRRPSMDEIINLDELISFCTTIIFNCTAQHSAVNDSQYDIFGYLPNMPLQLLGNPPTIKVLIISQVLFISFHFWGVNKFPWSFPISDVWQDHVTESDLMQHLPDLDVTLRTILLMRLLSARLDHPLGEWDIRHQFDLKVMQEESRYV